MERYRKRLELNKAIYGKRKAKLRELYQYARFKGFSPTEAQALSFESKGLIDKLAEEKAK